MSIQATSVIRKPSNVRNMVQAAMLGAVATVLMLFEIPLWFAPGFYEIDLSEVPVLIGAFTMGPVAGAAIELIKILMNLVLNGTITAGVGEMANFLLGCSFVIPAAIIYRQVRTRRGAMIAMTAGTLIMTIVGCIVNAFVLLPAYAAALMPLDALIGMGSALNPAITDLTTFVFYAVAPFNLLKGVVVSIVTLLLYKKISPILKKHE